MNSELRHRVHTRICEWWAQELCSIHCPVGRIVCEVSGITLKYKAWKLVNFEVIRDMISGTGEPTVTDTPRGILDIKGREEELYP